MAVTPNPNTPNSQATASSLGRALAQSGDLRRVQELEKTGIQHVRVLSHSQLYQTMQSAVNQALRAELEGLDLDDGVRANLERRVQVEFSRLVSGGGVAMAASSGASPATSTATPDGALPPALRQEVKTLSALTGGGAEATANAANLEQRLVSSIGALLAEDVRKQVARVSDSQRRQVEVLEERIAKLAQALESTDRILEHIQDHPQGQYLGSDSPADGGMPSSPLGEKKSELLDALFQANLALQQLKGDSLEQSAP